MAFEKNSYYYDGQFRTYILQFMAIFSGLQVEVGKRDDAEPTLITVPIHYAAPDRVAAAILSQNTQNKPLRLPVMSAFLRDVQFEPIRTAGQTTQRRQSYVPSGGLVPDDIKVVSYRKPLPVTIAMDLYLYASNSDQLFQMLEQFLPLFEPDLLIDTSDGLFDATRQVSVKLIRTTLDMNPDAGSDRRINKATIQFEIAGWISLPADVRTNFVQKIFMRVGAVSSGATTSEQMIAELDAEGFTYDLVQDTSDLDID